MVDVIEDFDGEPDFQLVPVEDEAVSAADELDAAATSLLEQLGATPDPVVVPLGRSWAFDFERGRFKREGVAPVQVTGIECLQQWVLAALHTKAAIHPGLPDTFGMAHVDEYIGTSDPGEALADFEDDATEALTIHDRIAEVDDVEADYDPSTGIITLSTLDIVTDQQDAVAVLSDVAVNLRPELTP